MRVLVTGAAGMLGGALMRACPEGIEAVPTSRANTDLADTAQVAELFADGFDGVIHAAGYTRVDDAEREELAAYRDNAEAAREVAAVCARGNIPLVVVSRTLPVTASAMDTVPTALSVITLPARGA